MYNTSLNDEGCAIKCLQFFKSKIRRKWREITLLTFFSLFLTKCLLVFNRSIGKHMCMYRRVFPYIVLLRTYCTSVHYVQGAHSCGLFIKILNIPFWVQNMFLKGQVSFFGLKTVVNQKSANLGMISARHTTNRQSFKKVTYSFNLPVGQYQQPLY